MKGQDKISIIVPIYNVEKYIEKCLKSLLNQTYTNVVIYAVIDGSPDNSLEIVKRMSKEDERIICIEKENGGYGSVLEYAINIIDSEYFMICDPDDWLERNAVDVLYKISKENNLDIIVGDKFLVYENNDEKKYCSSNLSHNIVKPNEVLENDELYKMALLSVSPHSKMYRTSLVKNVSFPKKVSYTDFFLYIVILSNSKRGFYLTEALSNYLIERVGNTTTDKSKKAILNHITVFNATYEYLKNKNEVNSYLYLKLYEQYRCACLELVANISSKEASTISEQLMCIDLLKEKKKEIIKKIEYDNFLKTIYNKLVCQIIFYKKLRLLFIYIKRKIKYKK